MAGAAGPVVAAHIAVVEGHIVAEAWQLAAAVLVAALVACKNPTAIMAVLARHSAKPKSLR